MTEHSYTVEVQPDFLERQSKARPVQAVAELIWNGLDADASRVDVRLEYDELGMTKIVVRDDGQGIPYEDAPQLFTRLGGSWKHPGGRTKTKERMLHGYEGRGRFKVFGASAIKCCYAAAGSGTGAEETELRALVSSKTSIRDHKGIVVAKKMSRKVSRRVVRPACIAGVRISRPNFRAPCGRTKL